MRSARRAWASRTVDDLLLASSYAQLGMREEYIAQLDVVAAQDGYEDWAWYDFVEAQRADPERLLAKFASFGEDEYSSSMRGFGVDPERWLAGPVVATSAPFAWHGVRQRFKREA